MVPTLSVIHKLRKKMNNSAKLANAFTELCVLLESKAISSETPLTLSKSPTFCTLSYSSNKLNFARLGRESNESSMTPQRNNFQISVHINHDKGTIYNYYKPEDSNGGWLQLYKTKPILTSDELVNLWIKKLLHHTPKN